MSVGLAFLGAGLLLLAMALVGGRLERLPLSTAMIYLAVGGALGLTVFRGFEVLGHPALLEHLTEVAVIVSLFASGLKLRTPLTGGRWTLPVRLATLSMVVTVFLVAAAGVALLGLSWGAALLLGAVLAPTDPVLASDVQLEDAFDRDQLRFALTGEAGLNDGTAFPFVMLGLGLLLHPPTVAGGLEWLAVDLLWATGAGLAAGWGLGLATGHLVLYLRREHREGVGLDDLLALGLIALSYGLALSLHAYGFLAVFAAGVALRRVEAGATGERPPEAVKALAEEGKKEEIATRPESAPAFMAQAVLEFSEQLERIAEVALMILVGVMLVNAGPPNPASVGAALLLLFVFRPLSVVLGLLGADVPRERKRMMSWFGIRGIGSLYYFFYAVTHGLSFAVAEQLLSVVLMAIAASVFLHGVSVTPLMRRYQREERS